MIQKTKTAGFTVIELLLAMTFVAILLLGVAMATIHISNTYTRGITLREVNQAGRSVTDDINRTVGASSPIVDGDYTTTAKSGRLCVGSYTYVWNYGEALRSASTAGLYVYDDGKPVRFARVSDAGKGLCASPTLTIDRSTRTVTELLSDGERNLALHRLSIEPGTVVNGATGQGLHAISFVIGTNSGGESIASANCLPPSDSASDAQYCAMNEFNTIVRSNNASGGE